jgi:hypothetical protein
MLYQTMQNALLAKLLLALCGIKVFLTIAKIFAKDAMMHKQELLII